MTQDMVNSSGKAHGGTLLTRLLDADRALAVHSAGADTPEIVQSLAVALSAGATKARLISAKSKGLTEKESILQPGLGAC